MAKLKNIRYLLKSALNDLEAYGQKKHADKLKTYEDRKVLKQHGFTQAEREKEANYMKDKIYSIKTMETYQREVSKFADWLNENSMGKITLEQAALQIQPYMDHLKERGLSASSMLHIFKMFPSTEISSLPTVRISKTQAAAQNS